MFEILLPSSFDGQALHIERSPIWQLYVHRQVNVDAFSRFATSIVIQCLYVDVSMQWRRRRGNAAGRKRTRDGRGEWKVWRKGETGETRSPNGYANTFYSPRLTRTCAPRRFRIKTFKTAAFGDGDENVNGNERGAFSRATEQWFLRQPVGGASSVWFGVVLRVDGQENVCRGTRRGGGRTECQAAVTSTAAEAAAAAAASITTRWGSLKTINKQ